MNICNIPVLAPFVWVAEGLAVVALEVVAEAPPTAVDVAEARIEEVVEELAAAPGVEPAVLFVLLVVVRT